MADGSAKLSRRDYEFQETTLRRESTVRTENLRGESHGDREEFQPDEAKDDAAARKDFRSIQGDFFCRHHIEPIEPRVQLTCREMNHSSFPLKYNDVIRSTFSDLEIAQEKRIYDYWNVDENRILSYSWTGFTRFTLLNETPPKGYMWPRRGGADKKIKRHHVQITYGLKHGQELGKPLKEETRMGNRETAMPFRRPCSRTRIRETVVLKTTRANVSEVKKRPSCIDIAGKGRNSVLYFNFVQEFVPMKRSDQSSSPNFLLKVKGSVCCLASRHSVPVQQNSSSNPKPTDSHVWT